MRRFCPRHRAVARAVRLRGRDAGGVVSGGRVVSASPGPPRRIHPAGAGWRLGVDRRALALERRALRLDPRPLRRAAGRLHALGAGALGEPRRRLGVGARALGLSDRGNEGRHLTRARLALLLLAAGIAVPRAARAEWVVCWFADHHDRKLFHSPRLPGHRRRVAAQPDDLRGQRVHERRDGLARDHLRRLGQPARRRRGGSPTWSSRRAPPASTSQEVPAE